MVKVQVSGFCAHTHTQIGDTVIKFLPFSEAGRKLYNQSISITIKVGFSKIVVICGGLDISKCLFFRKKWEEKLNSAFLHRILFSQSPLLSLVTQSCLTPCYPMDCSSPICQWGFSRQEHWSVLPCPPLGDLTELHLPAVSAFVLILILLRDFWNTEVRLYQNNVSSPSLTSVSLSRDQSLPLVSGGGDLGQAAQLCMQRPGH